MHHKPGEMSGGQQQRVAIARALINRPPLLLADEPTGALDSRTGEEVMQLFDSLCAQGHTIVLITHEADIARHASRVCVMKDGVLHEGEHHLDATTGRRHDPADILRTSVFALRGNWMRSTLTSLGVIIGIAAVIIMVSVGKGTQAEIDKMVSGLGSNRLDISGGAPNQGGVRGAGGSNATLTDADAPRSASRSRKCSTSPRQPRATRSWCYAENNWSTELAGRAAGLLRHQRLEAGQRRRA
jgi:macrolide transport system ATP-binding/permease protein